MEEEEKQARLTKWLVFKVEDVDDGDGDGDDEDDAAVQYQLDLHDLASNLSMQWQKDDWVAVKYSNDWYPGVIIEVISIL